MAEITRQVGASSDDCARQKVVSYCDFTHTDVNVGYYSITSYKRGGGMRFTNVTIPKGSTIDTAHLILRGRSSKSVTVVNSRISAEDVDDAPTFTNDGDAFDTRWANRTTARVDWDAIPAWTQDEDYNSPEIKTIIKEIVDRANWASGNDIVIFWEDFDDRSTHAFNCLRAGYSYDSSIEFAPKLVIEYTPLVVGWTGKISGVTNPAKIMGVAVANIAKVKGVA